MEKSEIIKMKYEKPVILNLGEMVKGIGLCTTNGSGNIEDSCTAPGASPAAPCTATGFANQGDNCSSGNGTRPGGDNSPCSGGGQNTGLSCNTGSTPNPL